MEARAPEENRIFKLWKERYDARRSVGYAPTFFCLSCKYAYNENEEVYLLHMELVHFAGRDRGKV